MASRSDVELVRWPAQRARVEELRARAHPRLLVVEDDRPPPPTDCLEDWVAAGASEWEIGLRRDALACRAARHGAHPILDDHGLLRHQDGWVALSPVERALAAVLAERYRSVVSREALARRAWPSGPPTRNALDVHLLRLRRRIAPLGLEIRTVRARGYLLQATTNGS